MSDGFARGPLPWMGRGSAGTAPRLSAIVQRQLDASRRELHSMSSEIEHYGEEFSGPQLLAMRKTMRALRELIKALEQ